MNETVAPGPLSRRIFQSSYSTDLGHNLVRDFFEPCLTMATRYDRVTGDFCSSFLSAGAAGFSNFFVQGGTMRLVTNGRFTESDYEALDKGTAVEKVIEDALWRDIKGLETLDQDDFRRRHLQVFAWLLKEDRIRLKVAVVRNRDKLLPADQARGIFHSKVGIFYWEDGSIISFIGGLNESQRALMHNSESFDPAYSWMGHQDRIHKHIEQFETLWLNDSPYSEVFDFPEAVAQQLVSMYAPSHAPIPPSLADILAFQAEQAKENPAQPLAYQLRDYQQERIVAWKENGYRGVLSMATGTGKTFTAIAAAQQWIEETPDSSHLVIISAPQQHIVQQWAREVTKFTGVQPLSTVDSRHWQEDLAGWFLRHRLESSSTRSLFVVATNDALLSKLMDALRQIPVGSQRVKALVIGDEAHSLGTQLGMDALESVAGHVAATLGLTATPTRHFDDAGTARLFGVFGKELPAYTLADAIQDGWLCPYEYEFTVLELTEDEYDEYKRLTAQLKPYLFDKEGGIDWATLARTAVILDASCKLDFLDAFLKAKKRPFSLFYCSPHHLTEVSSRLAKAGYRRAQITYKTKTAERMPILQNFSDGTYEALVAIECLDEGVDIPAARTAVFLASTTNPKQYIQRRGRVLRKAPGKSSALIYDVLVGPALPHTKPQSVVFRREFERARAFAMDATNSEEAVEKLKMLEILEDLK